MNLGKLIFEVLNFLLSPFTKGFFLKLDKNNSINRTVNLYPNPKFMKIRFWDAPFTEVEKLIPKKGTILDLGCGEGIFTNFLGISSNSRKITAVEINRQRIKEASRGVKNVIFKYGDVTKIPIPKVDTILIFHLLHHLPSRKSQENLIKKCAEKLLKEGQLIIVEVEPKFSIKFLLASFTDHFLVPWLFEGRFYSPIYFRRSKEWVKILNDLGFSCIVISAEKGMPFSHIILDCTKL